MGKKTSTARVEIKELIIVDTDILIDIALKISDAINYLNNIENQFELAVSIITQMELYAGCRNKAELKNIEQFLIGTLSLFELDFIACFGYSRRVGNVGRK